MNYLILTPDGVGSTILQRLLTMTLHIEGIDVMNTHELTNGLALKNGVVVKDTTVEYTQSLHDIEKMLQNSKPSVTLVSRLAKYHLDARKDQVKDQKTFYEFLNKFYPTKVKCVRKNIFEYAMSWSIRKESGVLNVYHSGDRKKVSAINEVNEQYFLQKCNEYVEYENWIEDNFPNAETVAYEKLLTDSDSVMKNFIGDGQTFKKRFGIDLNTVLKKEYDLQRGNTDALSRQEQKGLVLYKQYGNELNENKIITTSMPMKNTTLLDKKMQIKNFDKCLDSFYTFAKNHNWIDQSNATYDFWNKKHL